MCYGLFPEYTGLHRLAGFRGCEQQSQRRGSYFDNGEQGTAAMVLGRYVRLVRGEFRLEGYTRRPLMFIVKGGQALYIP